MTENYRDNGILTRADRQAAASNLGSVVATETHVQVVPNGKLHKKEQTWEDIGRCITNPEINMFPDRPVEVEIAKRFCVPCPARDDCLEFALTTRQNFGVWGGMSEDERRLELRRRTQNARYELSP
jgi:WhiB family redox-sensing transcriptional regulator